MIGKDFAVMRFPRGNNTDRYKYNNKGAVVIEIATAPLKFMLLFAQSFLYVSEAFLRQEDQRQNRL